MKQNQQDVNLSSQLGQTAYLNGVALKDNDNILRALQCVYGRGYSRARKVCQQFSRATSTTVAERRRANMLSSIESWVTEVWDTESQRRRTELEVIKLHMTLGSRRGIRMRQGRPVRGQRTSTNAKTAKRLNARRGS